jgi:hypothetical protein
MTLGVIMAVTTNIGVFCDVIPAVKKVKQTLFRLGQALRVAEG